MKGFRNANHRYIPTVIDVFFRVPKKGFQGSHGPDAVAFCGLFFSCEWSLEEGSLPEAGCVLWDAPLPSTREYRVASTRAGK